MTDLSSPRPGRPGCVDCDGTWCHMNCGPRVSAEPQRPRRIRLSRAKGWRLPEGAIKVDRSTPWGNPFIVGTHGDQAYCVELYRYLAGGFFVLCNGPDNIERQRAARAYIQAHIHDLRGHDLACWCAPAAPCHADVLLEMANR